MREAVHHQLEDPAEEELPNRHQGIEQDNPLWPNKFIGPERIVHELRHFVPCLRPIRLRTRPVNLAVGKIVIRTGARFEGAGVYMVSGV
jgi:hypothetical protein